jgi:hypothetical protein
VGGFAADTSIGQFDIELTGPYAGPPWTMNLEGVNGHKYKYGTPSPSVYDGYLIIGVP